MEYKPTEKGLEVLRFLAGTEIGEEFTGAEIASGLDDFHATGRSVSGRIRSLSKNGLVQVNRNSEPLKYSITDEGRDFMERL